MGGDSGDVAMTTTSQVPPPEGLLHDSTAEHNTTDDTTENITDSELAGGRIEGTASESGLQDDGPDEDRLAQLSPEERTTFAASCREAGNLHLKSNELECARAQYDAGLKYVTGIDSLGIALEQKRMLHLNLSLALLKMELWQESAAQADAAIQLDPNNTKGLYRRGTAYMKLGKLDEAQMDFVAAVNIDKSNVDARRALATVKQRLQEQNQKTKQAYSGLFDRTSGGLYADRAAEERRKENARRKRFESDNATRKEEGKEELSYDEWRDVQAAADEAAAQEAKQKKKPRPPSSDADKSSAGHKPKPSAPVRADSGSDIDEEDLKVIAETKKKGYCYFRRELPPEEKEALQRASAPTPYSGSAAEGVSPPSSGLQLNSQSSISSWNCRGTTWEEKDMTKWAKECLQRVLGAVKVTKQPFDNMQDVLAGVGSMNDLTKTSEMLETLGLGFDAAVIAVESIDGDAHLAVVRGSCRCLYDFDITLKWEATLKGTSGLDPGNAREIDMTVRGKIHLPELSSSRLKGQSAVDCATVTIDGSQLDQSVKKCVDAMLNKLKEGMSNAVSVFESEFRDSNQK